MQKAIFCYKNMSLGSKKQARHEHLKPFEQTPPNIFVR